MLPITDAEDRRLLSLRSRARRRGILVKSSARPMSETTNLGGLMILDAVSQTVIAGRQFDLSVEAAEREFDQYITDFESKVLAEAGGLIR